MILLLLSVCLLVTYLNSTTSYAHGYVESPLSRIPMAQREGRSDLVGSVSAQSMAAMLNGAWPNDGQLISVNGRGNGLSDRQTPTMWSKTNIAPGWNTITWRYTASHATAVWRFFITHQGWNQNAPLTRAAFDMTPIGEEFGNGRHPGTHSSHQVFIPMDRSGYHVIYAVWSRTDSPETFYSACDVNVINGNITGTIGAILPGDGIPPAGLPIFPGPLDPWQPGMVPFRGRMVSFEGFVYSARFSPHPHQNIGTPPENPNLWELIGRLPGTPDIDGGDASAGEDVNSPDFNYQRFFITTAMNDTSRVEASGNQLRLWSATTGANQVWQFSLDRDTDSYTIQNTGDRRYLSDTGSAATLTNTINNHSRWHVFPSTNFTYQFINVGTGRVLDVSGGNTTANGTAVTTWSRAESRPANQRFNLVIAPDDGYTGGDTGNGTGTQPPFPEPSPTPPNPEPNPETGMNPPTNLHVTHQTQTSLTLTWDPPYLTGDLLNYEIFRDGVKIANVTDTIYTDTGLQPGTTYLYTVRVHALSDHSDEVTGITHPDTGSEPQEPEQPTESNLNPPTNLRSVSQTQTSITLAWDAPQLTGVVLNYELFRDGIKIATVNGYDQTYTDTGLQPSTTYHYSIRAQAASIHSNSVTGTTTAQVAPANNFTHRLTGTSGNHTLTIINQTNQTLPTGWQLQFNFTGMNPTVHAPATQTLGVGGQLSSVVHAPIPAHGQLTIPVTGLLGLNNMSNVRINGTVAPRE